MNILHTSQRKCVGLLTLASLVGVMGAAQAQTTTHKNIIKRHPTASAVVAGAAAHHYAKKSSHGLLHRHPVATGLAAAAVTHHYAKKKPKSP